jgi:hypothetical protein
VKDFKILFKKIEKINNNKKKIVQKQKLNKDCKEIVGKEVCEMKYL